jgi:hypothetical protein
VLGRRLGLEPAEFRKVVTGQASVDDPLWILDLAVAHQMNSGHDSIVPYASPTPSRCNRPGAEGSGRAGHEPVVALLDIELAFQAQYHSELVWGRGDQTG